MAALRSAAREPVLDEQILALLRVHRTLLFTVLADHFPEYRWQALFTALHRLKERQVVNLVPRLWDYEVSLQDRQAGGADRQAAQG